MYFFLLLGLCTEGLYRVSGNKTDQDNIQKQFDQGMVYKIKSFFKLFSLLKFHGGKIDFLRL